MCNEDRREGDRLPGSLVIGHIFSSAAWCNDSGATQQLPQELQMSSPSQPRRRSPAFMPNICLWVLKRIFLVRVRRRRRSSKCRAQAGGTSAQLAGLRAALARPGRPNRPGSCVRRTGPGGRAAERRAAGPGPGGAAASAALAALAPCPGQ